MRIINEYRNNRITVDFTPKDGEGDVGDDELADTCDGLYRADEQACTANEAYDNAFDEGVQGGFGRRRSQSTKTRTTKTTTASASESSPFSMPTRACSLTSTPSARTRPTPSAPTC